MSPPAACHSLQVSRLLLQIVREAAVWGVARRRQDLFGERSDYEEGIMRVELRPA
jgi:hypothetical protein